MKNSEPARGMRDILPESFRLREFVKNKIMNVYEQFGFQLIETPCVEKIELLTSGEGGDNEKMIYKILKRGEKLKFDNCNKIDDLVDLGLRYDLTVPLSRFFSNNRSFLRYPFKSIQFGPVWRAERPQRGRYRQFVQFDIDIIGEESEMAEIELIMATHAALSSLNFQNLTVRINDRRILSAVVSEFGFEKQEQDRVLITLDKMDKIGKDGVSSELIRLGFPNKSIAKLIDFIEKIEIERSNKGRLEILSRIVGGNVIDRLRNVIRVTEAQINNLHIVVDPKLVRGMGYYTGQIFEIECSEFNGSIAGGGRYDNMIGKYLGESIPACGFSIGFERIITILEEKKIELNLNTESYVLLYKEDDLPKMNDVFNLATFYRSQGATVLLTRRKKNYTNQLKSYQREGYTGYIFIDKKGKFVLRYFETNGEMND